MQLKGFPFFVQAGEAWRLHTHMRLSLFDGSPHLPQRNGLSHLRLIQAPTVKAAMLHEATSRVQVAVGPSRARQLNPR